jgi:hypothetical protein
MLGEECWLDSIQADFFEQDNIPSVSVKGGEIS